MKVSGEIINMLNARLAEEHAAFVQYTTHSAMCANNGYKKLAAYIKERAEQEREHAQELIDRILFLEGTPIFEIVAPVTVGKDVVEMFPLDQTSEVNAIAGYAEGINLCVANNDFGTRKLLEHILEEEEAHLNAIESNIAQIVNSGIENYLIAQVD